MAAWTALIGPMAGFIGKWQQRRAEESQAKHEARIAMIKEHGDSAKDEFILIVWSYPVISLFIPGLSDHTFAVFEKIDQLPDWYLAGWTAISLAIYGIIVKPKLKGLAK